MNVSIAKDQCRVACINAKELRIISYDEVHGRGCDLIIVSSSGEIYVIECKESLKSGSTLNKVLQQIEECVNFVKKHLGSGRVIRRVFIKGRGKRGYSPFINELKDRGVEIYEDALEIRG